MGSEARGRELFRAGHYNIIAARIRDAWPVSAEAGKCQSLVDTASVGTLILLSLSLAKRLQEDNERFNPYMWFEACVPPAWMPELLEAFQRDE